MSPSRRAATEALPSLGSVCDAVVLDEAQDLAEADWLFVEELSQGRPFWAFLDPAQAFWDDHRVPEPGTVENFQRLERLGDKAAELYDQPDAGAGNRRAGRTDPWPSGDGDRYD